MESITKELSIGNWFISEGVICSLTPITNIEEVEKELKNQVVATMNENMLKEKLLRDVGLYTEWFTANGWQVFFPKELLDSVVIGAPFKGDIMSYEYEKEIYGEDGEIERKEMDITIIYVPSGYLVLCLEVNNEYKLKRYHFHLLPYLNYSLRYLFSKKISAYKLIHPHLMSSLELCHGMNMPVLKSFDMNEIIALMISCIKGTGNNNSIWDYNRHNPATKIQDCIRGMNAYKLHIDGKNDDEIWRDLDGNKSRT